MPTLGLIALSGLRVCDSSLLKRGLSFPSLASRASQIEAIPSLGLLTLAALTPPEFNIEYHEVRDIKDIPTHFDVVALSTLTATAKEAYHLSAKFREIGTTVILGGLHATLCPECSNTENSTPDITYISTTYNPEIPWSEVDATSSCSQISLQYS